MARDVVKELTGVIVFAEIGQAGCVVHRDEMRSIKNAWEILADAATLRCTWVDTDLHNVHLAAGIDVRSIKWLRDRRVLQHRDGNQVWTFILLSEKPMPREIRSVFPVFQVRGGENADGELLSVADHSHPVRRFRVIFRLVPEDFRITELGTVGWYDWILGVLGECVPSIERICNLLSLGFHCIQCVPR